MLIGLAYLHPCEADDAIKGIVFADATRMLSDRKRWTPPYKNSLPSLPCCACKTGFLHPVPDSIKTMETGQSEEAHGLEAWDVDWIDSRFVAFAQCTNPACRHVVSVCGKVAYEENYETHPNGEWDRTADPIYTPQAFFEAPPLIRVCDECPAEVSEQLNRSFALYWVDRSACATAIRTAVELLLDERGIPKEVKNKYDKPVRLPLHDRIVQFQKVNPEAGKLLLAIKVIGNVGAHTDDVTLDDLLTGYEILDHVIDVVYSVRAIRVAGLADEILARLGARP